MHGLNCLSYTHLLLFPIYVQCDKCMGWVHIIYTVMPDDTYIEYECPECAVL